jgi:aspartyl aminopeptidase
MTGRAAELARSFLRFVDASPSPFHAVHSAKDILNASGFEALSEGSLWNGRVKPGGKYYYTRNASTLVAFCVGGAYKNGNGHRIIAAHTDSPVPKVKPKPFEYEKEEYKQIGIQLYGGGLWYTWFDRDLTVAGRVIVRERTEKEITLNQRLVHIPSPILRIPSLAIHLNRTVNTDGFQPNAENEIIPVIATSFGIEATGVQKTTPILLDIIAKHINVDINDIIDFELVLADTQPAALGGSASEFIFSPRLDNLLSSFAAIDALVTSLPTLSEELGVRMCVLFDNEEVGSQSYAGADSSLIDSALTRITSVLSNNNNVNSSQSEEIVQISFRKSFLISADMAHAIHPNYPSKHESNHKPYFHKGIVIKQNANMRYATTAATSAPIRELAARHQIPLQEFVVRNDMG